MITRQIVDNDKDYSNPVVHRYSNGREVVVISDLHISSGLQEDSNYDGTENFYADDSFARFLRFLMDKQKDKKTVLIINGDFIDFLRILHLPSGHDFETWEKILVCAGIQKSADELQQSISKKEKKFGLKTNDYKSVWKLHRCVYGHKILFQQLAFWLSEGNSIYILKGNHDLEWYWKPVRDYLGYIFAELASKINNNSTGYITQNLQFFDNALILDSKIYIVHGHIFENMTEVKGSPALNNNTELNLPFGSFFNRYMINRLELSYPFLDNIRPTQKIFPVLIRERFPLALQYMFYYIPFTVLIIPKKLYKEVFKYLFDIFIIIILPVLITAYAVYKNVHFSSADHQSFIGKQLINLLKNLAPLFLSYIFARLLEMARLSSPTNFFQFAKQIFADNKDIKTVIFGHTHNPEQHKDGDKWYFNTGTWMPVYDLSMADVRLDKTYTYLQIVPGSTAAVESQLLLRWNDDAARPEPMVLRDLR